MGKLGIDRSDGQDQSSGSLKWYETYEMEFVSKHLLIKEYFENINRDIQNIRIYNGDCNTLKPEIRM